MRSSTAWSGRSPVNTRTGPWCGGTRTRNITAHARILRGAGRRARTTFAMASSRSPAGSTRGCASRTGLPASSPTPGAISAGVPSSSWVCPETRCSSGNARRSPRISCWPAHRDSSSATCPRMRRSGRPRRGNRKSACSGNSSGGTRSRGGCTSSGRSSRRSPARRTCRHAGTGARCRRRLGPLVVKYTMTPLDPPSWDRRRDRGRPGSCGNELVSRIVREARGAVRGLRATVSWNEAANAGRRCHDRMARGRRAARARRHPRPSRRSSSTRPEQMALAEHLSFTPWHTLTGPRAGWRGQSGPPGRV